MKIAIYTIVFQFISIALLAQQVITMRGRVMDQQTNQPLAFATIGIPQTGVGVVSNEYGEFTFHVPIISRTDTIYISYLGYKKVKIPANTSDTAHLLVIKLAHEVYNIADVQVKSKIRANELVQRAVAKIPENCSAQPFRLYGFYRDYLKDDTAYLNLIEAAMIVEDYGFATNDKKETVAQIEQLRISLSYQFDTLKIIDGVKTKRVVPYSGTITAKNDFAFMRNHDPIRNHNVGTFSYVNNFDKDFINNHSFQIKNVIRQDSQVVYCIEFEKFEEYTTFQVGTRQYLVYGTIYINSSTLAILKMTYKVTCKTPKYSGVFFDLTLEYKDYQGKMYPNYLSLKNYFEMKDNSISAMPVSGSTAKPLFQYREFFVNKIVAEPFAKFSPDFDVLMRKDIPLIKNTVPPIEGFWDRYNYVSNRALLK
jgi:hypothetical protein